MKAAPLIPLALATVFLPGLSLAQAPQPARPALPESAAATPIPPPIVPAAEPAEVEVVIPAPAPAHTPVVKPNAPTATVPVIPKRSTTPGKDGIVMNFQGASLSEVLNYLSEAAGFVIVQEAPVAGTVNIVSKQAITAEEAVDLVNAVLIEKGFIAIRNGRILKIVNRRDAQKRDLPVQMGSDPELIPRKDDMVTQILPLRYGEAAKLVENLRPLLAESATISANEGSNSILLTDTQNNIRRIAQIIRAIDTSVASISTIQVYPLQYADAKELATVVTQLFASGNVGNQGRGGRGGRGGGFGFPFGGGGQGGGDQGGGGQSEAKQAASKVVAVADEQSNSLIVCAPEDMIPTITDIVQKIDTSITDVTDTRIFRLEHADATELAQIVNTLYNDTSTQNNQNRGRQGQQQGFGRGGGFNPFGGQPQAAAGSQQSQRALLQSKVVAVGDPRTNSLIVTAARESMTQIAETIGRLDATDAKRQRVFVHSLEHADVESVANVLRGMLGDQTATTNTQSASSRLNERSATGAAMETSDTFGSGFGGGTGGRAR